MRILAVISAGGAIGAAARYGLGVALPHVPGEFPWATFAVNISGCLLIGVLMALLQPEQKLIRLFLGTGILGGYTTFSTYTVDFQQLIEAGRVAVSFAYLAGTLITALAAVYVGSAGVTAWKQRTKEES